MFIKQIYTSCLSEAAYFIEHNGEAAVIDPLRDIEAYLQLAKERKASIKYIFETHFHADFVSGHLDLQAATGAPIVYGPGTKTKYPIHLAADGEEFSIGNFRIEVLHTPGHTLESSCFLLKDEEGVPKAVFTGDTLFVGDVGRPDLSSGNLSSEELASILFDSIQNRIKTLPDDVVVYPAHGPGSSCGKNLGPETESTIGKEKAGNYALTCTVREEFIKAVTTGLNTAPQYFPVNAKINSEGYEALDAVLARGMQALSVEEFKELLKDPETVLLDSRNASLFTEGFIPESISIGLEGRFAEWAGSLLPFDKNLLIVTEPGKEKETLVRLARVGFSRFAGYLADGLEAWKEAGEAVDMIVNVDADELAMDLPYDENLVVVDVRKPTEYEQGHITGAMNIPLDRFNDPLELSGIEDQDNVYIHCAGGYRSVIGASLYKRQGIHNLRNVVGGWSKIKEEERIPKTSKE